MSLTDAPPDTRPAPSAVPRLRALAARLLGSEHFVLWLTLAYFLALLPTLGTPANLVNLLSNMWPLPVVAIGQTFVMAVAGIDLSQGAVMALTSTIAAALLATAADPAVLATITKAAQDALASAADRRRSVPRRIAPVLKPRTGIVDFLSRVAKGGGIEAINTSNYSEFRRRLGFGLFALNGRWWVKPRR